MKLPVTILCLTLLFFACTKKEVVIPDDVLKQKEMTAILTDVHIAQSAIGNAITTDSSKYTMADYLEYILADHQTTKKEFTASLKFYSDHPEMLQAVYDSVITGLSKIEAGLEN